MPSTRFSLVAAALAGVLALASASAVGEQLLAGGIAIVQLVFALGVIRASRLPSARPAAWLALAAGLVTLVWVERNGTPELAPMAVVLGPVVLVAFLVQLFRRDGRAGLNGALGLVVTACVLTTLPVAWLALRATTDGVHVVGLALLGVGLVALVEALPISAAVRRVLGVVLASTASAVLVVAVTAVGDAVPAVSAVVISAFAGVMAAVAFAIADRLAGEAPPVEAPVLVTVPDDTPPRFADDTADQGTTSAAAQQSWLGTQPKDGSGPIVPLRVVAPFVAAAPAAYVLGQLLVR